MSRGKTQRFSMEDGLLVNIQLLFQRIYQIREITLYLGLETESYPGRFLIKENEL